MICKYRSGNGNRAKCTLPLPLLMGFITGFLSVYTYYLLLNFEHNRIRITPAITQSNSEKYFIPRYYQLNTTKPSTNRTVSLLCLVFINDIDSLLMQHNVWLNKCDNKIYMSKYEQKYIGDVVTDTYSSHPWKYYCQTLIYLNNIYSSGNIKYDWIFLAQDNIWLIYENLIHLISLINDNKHKRSYYAGQYVNDVLNTDAGVLLSTNTLIKLINLFAKMDACNEEVSDSENHVLDFYLKKLSNVMPVSNMDLYGCTLFHSINLFDAFNVNSLKPDILKTCMSRYAVTFQLNLYPNCYAMFYAYVLYQIRLVNQHDLMLNNVLPVQSSEDIWRLEALYELNIDPANMSQTDFNYYWSKKRQIIL